MALWQASVLSPTGAHSVRGSKADAVVIGLLVQRKDGSELLRGGFDGFYTCEYDRFGALSPPPTPTPSAPHPPTEMI